MVTASENSYTRTALTVIPGLLTAAVLARIIPRIEAHGQRG